MNSDQDPALKTSAEWITELAESIRLREGAEGITRALWTLQGGKIHSTRDWAAAIQIPVPVLAALRRELEKRDILEKDKKLRLTETGLETLRSLFGHQDRIDLTCPGCLGAGRIFPPEAMPVLEQFQTICEQRPHVDVTLDQSHATPETGIRKALLLQEKGLLSRSIFFMGDDDLISVACYLVRKHFMPENENPGRILAADIDSRYLELIGNVSGGQIETMKYDIREEFPAGYLNQFSTAFTDPAYTVNGITTFSYRCFSSLEAGGTLFLSMPFPDGKTLYEIQQNLVNIGFIFREILPGFNRYHGASIHASQTNLIIAEKVDPPPEKSLRLRYTPLYTGEVRPPGAVYACTACETRCRVGPEEQKQTIQELKQAGCVECGNDSFRRLSSKEVEEPNGSPSAEQ